MSESLQVRSHWKTQFEQFVCEYLSAELREMRRQKRSIWRENDSLGLGSWRAFMWLHGPRVLHMLEPCRLETSLHSLTCYITFPIFGGFWLGMGSNITRLFITPAPSKWLGTARSGFSSPSSCLSTVPPTSSASLRLQHIYPRPRPCLPIPKAKGNGS